MSDLHREIADLEIRIRARAGRVAAASQDSWTSLALYPRAVRLARRILRRAAAHQARAMVEARAMRALGDELVSLRRRLNAKIPTEGMPDPDIAAASRRLRRLEELAASYSTAAPPDEDVQTSE